MPFFPESLMPAHTKQESDDVPGNKYVVSAQDINKIDEEIRAIEQSVGVHLQDPTNPSNGTDAITCLANVVSRLNELRDSQLLTASGMIAIKDATIIGVLDNKIEFPTSWPITTLVDEISDDAEDDETELPAIDSLELADVSDMPDEGYVTIINDTSLERVMVSKDGKPIATGLRTAEGKVGDAFSYSIILIGDTSKVSSYSVIPKPAQPTLQSIGLGANGASIQGVPTTTGTSSYDVAIKDAAGGTLVSYSLTISIAAASTPVLVPETINVQRGVMFSHSIPAVSVSPTAELTPPTLPAGMWFYGPIGEGVNLHFVLGGTPQVVGSTVVNVKVTDAFGDFSAQNFTIITT